MAKKVLTPIDKLTRTVERGFAAVAEEFADVKKNMATGFAGVEARLLSIEQELTDIKRRLTALEDKFDRFGEKNKEEIEALWKRVIAIEKRLKMQR